MTIKVDLFEGGVLVGQTRFAEAPVVGDYVRIDGVDYRVEARLWDDDQSLDRVRLVVRCEPFSTALPGVRRS